MHRRGRGDLQQQLARLVLEAVGVAEEDLLQHLAPLRRCAAGDQQREAHRPDVALPDRERLGAELGGGHPDGAERVEGELAHAGHRIAEREEQEREDPSFSLGAARAISASLAIAVCRTRTSSAPPTWRERPA